MINHSPDRNKNFLFLFSLDPSPTLQVELFGDDTCSLSVSVSFFLSFPSFSVFDSFSVPCDCLSVFLCPLPSQSPSLSSLPPSTNLCPSLVLLQPERTSGLNPTGLNVSTFSGHRSWRWEESGGSRLCVYMSMCEYVCKCVRICVSRRLRVYTYECFTSFSVPGVSSPPKTSSSWGTHWNTLRFGVG